MLKPEKPLQLTFDGFNQSCGMQLDRSDEWVRLADAIDWEAIDALYRRGFRSGRGRPAASARIALGALIIQKRTGKSDREVVKEVSRNPYLQYFLGMPAFCSKSPFRHGVMTEFRKRFDVGTLCAVNETILKDAPPTPEHSKAGGKAGVEPTPSGNLGTAILDATCSPSNIRYPQDFSLLNEAREKLDGMIDRFHAASGEAKRPRTYRRKLRAAHLSMAKAKKRPAKSMRAHVRLMLEAVRRNMGFVDRYLAAGLRLAGRDEARLAVIRELYRQQREMFDEGKHRVGNRIVSLSQPFVRPIVRGKAKTPVEFGAKYDVSVDENGHARLEKASFDAYNECTVLKDAVERYRGRTGHYPKRLLVDQVYRTKDNRAYCEERGIEMSGRKPGRPPKDGKERRKVERIGRKNDVDRIEVERFFSRDKRCFGAGLIMAKMENTALASIALSVLVANLFGAGLSSFVFYIMDARNCNPSCHWLELFDDEA